MHKPLEGPREARPEPPTDTPSETPNDAPPEGMPEDPLRALLEARPGPALPDVRRMSPLQLAYVGDALHDLYVRTLLLSRPASVGAMHRRAVKLVSAGAQARMLEAISDELTPEEADVARRGRNAQAKHPAPKHADPADYAHATALEALWGYLYATGRVRRMEALLGEAVARIERGEQKEDAE